MRLFSVLERFLTEHPGIVCDPDLTDHMYSSGIFSTFAWLAGVEKSAAIE